MARPNGSKVIDCTGKNGRKKCTGKIVAMVGTMGVCVHCGEKVRFTKKLMRELGKDV